MEMLMKRFVLLLALFAVILLPKDRTGGTLVVKGLVTMEDGSAPPQRVAIERACGNSRSSIETLTDREGRYQLRRQVVAGSIEAPSSGSTTTAVIDGATTCELRAVLAGYQSTKINIDEWVKSGASSLPTLILGKSGMEERLREERGLAVPREALKAWTEASKFVEARRWPEAERQLQTLTRAHPRFAQAWYLLGTIQEDQKKPAEARQSYLRGIQADPKWLQPYSAVARLDIEQKDWGAAVKSTGRWIEADTRRAHPEAYVDNALARMRAHDLDGAESSALEAIRLDRKGLASRAEYVLAAILLEKRDRAGAIQHLERYLKLDPSAANAGAARALIAKLKTPDQGPVRQLDLAESNLPSPIQAWVHGGMRALATVAGIEEKFSFENFFTAYCRALARGSVTGPEDQVARYQARVLAFFDVAVKLGPAAGVQDKPVAVALALGDAERLAETKNALALLGWKLVDVAGTKKVEPGDQEADCPRQAVPPVFGIDEIAMQEALEAGKSYRFEIRGDTARLFGGQIWQKILRSDLSFSGGIAEAFAKDFRLARTYLGLSEMDSASAEALVAAVGLRALVVEHSKLLAGSARLWRVRDGAVEVPGGEPAEAMWKSLAGASPRDGRRFLRALFAKDGGRLARFYAAVAQSDEAHRKFYAKAPATPRLYALFRDRDWPASYLSDLPIGAQESVLAAPGRVEAILALARLQRVRASPLDEESSQILSRHLDEWESLLAYFERLPGLGGAEFRALESFAAALPGYPAAKRNQVLGMWHALVELTALGVKAGSLDARSSAQAFRQACGIHQGDKFAANALAALRSITGPSGSLDDAVPSRLLRLDGERRAAFETVRALQKVPSLDERAKASDENALYALSGQVYAAYLSPDGLLASEDPQLVRKHNFIELQMQARYLPPFPATELRLSTVGKASYYLGGFGKFGELTKTLAPGGAYKIEEARPAVAEGGVSSGTVNQPGEPPIEATFRADARLVEVYATVTNTQGHYVDELSRDRFQVMEEGRARPLTAFEPNTSNLTCALLLDTTGSMQAALPALKNAALKLIAELRGMDTVAVYTFRETLIEMQPFTTDKQAAKRAVLRAHPDGTTALYDSLARVSRVISHRSGKKVIVVFTDGADNASTLASDTVVKRAKTIGAPVYTIAQGQALRFPHVLKQLENVATATGGLSFAIHNPDEIRGVFEGIAGDLKHGYLLAFRPSEAKAGEWRKIEVRLTDAKTHKVRAREGFYGR
jgi:Ca-activated chloride channel family protein